MFFLVIYGKEGEHTGNSAAGITNQTAFNITPMKIYWYLLKMEESFLIMQKLFSNDHRIRINLFQEHLKILLVSV